MGEFYAVLALLLFGGNVFLVGPASARVAQRIGFLVVLLSNVVFAALLAGAQLLLRGRPLELDYPAVALFAVAGVFANYLGRWGYFRTVQTIGPSRASAIQNSSPLFAVVLAWLALDRRGDPGSAGPPRARGDGGGRRRSRLRRRQRPAGGAVDRWHEPLLGALLGAVGATLAYVTAQLRDLDWKVLGDLPRDGLLLWALSGVIMISAQASLIAATAYLPVGVVVAVSAATPVVVIPLSVLVFGNREQVTARVALGAALVTCGVAGLLVV